ncbi:MAG: hypothetical protein ACPF94_03785 [Candidatus Puniceispirillales bacterium]
MSVPKSMLSRPDGGETLFLRCLNKTIGNIMAMIWPLINISRFAPASCRVEKGLDKPLSGIFTLSALSQPDSYFHHGRCFICGQISYLRRIPSISIYILSQDDIQ